MAELFWWSFGGFAVRLGQPVWLLGTAFNSIILATVTVMTEQRMLTRWSAERAALYREYIRTTSPCIPWPPKKPAGATQPASGAAPKVNAKATRSATPKRAKKAS